MSLQAQSSLLDLSIVVVSWNVRGLLYACLQSIERNQAGLDLEVILVDSASSDGTVEMVKESFPWVKLIACNENVGFPRGNNMGIERANGRYILLLNPDTEIVGDALQTMLQYMESYQDVGVVGAQLLNTDGSVQSSRRRFPTLMTGFFESTWLQGAAPSLLRHYYMLDVPDNEQAEADWIMGACMFMRQEVVRQIGGMDEAYFMYSEELDLCHRIKANGWRVIYLPQAKIKHHYGKSSEQAVTSRHINFNRAKLRYFRKYHGRIAALVLRLFLLLNYVSQIVIEGSKGIVGHKRPLRWQRVKSYWAVVRSGLRPAGY
ncbi:MAG: glycosyltransferase family 2 protein [Chloroflexi bacterium]|nr:glycosyltransferase family 2 protein [Chloroflexota bacterium]